MSSEINIAKTIKNLLKQVIMIDNKYDMVNIAFMAKLNKQETVKITIEIDREVFLALSNKSDMTGVSQKNLSDMAYRKFLGLKPKFKKGEK